MQAVVFSSPRTDGGTTPWYSGGGLFGCADVVFMGGTLAGNATCTITVAVTGTAPGVQNNATGPISSTETGPGAVSNTATVTIGAAPPQSQSAVPALGPWMMLSLALLLAWGGVRLLRR